MRTISKSTKAMKVREVSDRAIEKHDAMIKRMREMDTLRPGGLSFKHGQIAADLYYEFLLASIDAASKARHTSFSETIADCQIHSIDQWRDAWYQGYVQELRDLLQNDGFEVTSVTRLEDRQTNSHTLEISW